MFFDRPSDSLDKFSHTGAPSELVGFGERTAAAFDATIKTGLTFSEEIQTFDEYERRNRLIKEKLGIDLLNPMTMANVEDPRLDTMGGFSLPSADYTAPPVRRDFHREYQTQLEKLAEKHPQHRDVIQPHRPVRATVAERARKAEERHGAMQDAYDGPWGTGPVADFIGGMAAQPFDPVNLATLAIGPTGRVGWSAREVLVMGAKQAGANAAVEAALQPKVQDWRAKVGLESGLYDGVSNVAMAAVFGFAADAGVRTAYRAAQQGLGRAPVFDAAGKVSGYEGQAAADKRAALKAAADQLAAEARTRAADIDAALARISPETRAAAEQGDPGALVQVAEAAGLQHDPRFASDLTAIKMGEGSRIEIDGIDDGSGLLAFEQMLRAATDPAEPPPVHADRTPPRARGPDLSDFADVPSGTQGNQFARTLEFDGKPAAFRTFDARELTTDAQAFQFKAGGNAAGVTGRLAQVSAWDPVASGKIVVFERADGRLVIADGHQRLELAKRLGDTAPGLKGFLFREADGWTVGDVRAMAAKKNIQEGTGSTIDAARMFRERPDIIDDRLPMDADDMRVARSLARLSDDAFDRVSGGAVPPKQGAMVADLVRDPAQHAAAIDELAQLRPETDRQARLAIGETIRAPFTKQQQLTLFGVDAAPRFLLAQRLDVLDSALNALRSDVQPDAGNRPVTADDVHRALEANTVAMVIERTAQARGVVSDWLNDASRAVAEGQPKSTAVNAFLRRVEALVDEKGIRGLDDEPVVLASFGGRKGAERLEAAGSPQVADASVGRSMLRDLATSMQPKLLAFAEQLESVFSEAQRPPPRGRMNDVATEGAAQIAQMQDRQRLSFDQPAIDALASIRAQELRAEQEKTTLGDSATGSTSFERPFDTEQTPLRTNAEGMVMMLPFAEKWGDPRFDPEDRSRALGRLNEILFISSRAVWSDLVQAVQDIDHITSQLLYYKPDMSSEEIRQNANLHRVSYIMQVDSSGGEQISIFARDTGVPEDVIAFARAGRHALDHLRGMRRKGILNLLEADNPGDMIEPTSKSKPDALDVVGKTMRSGFYFESGRQLDNVSDAVFAQGGRAVINALSQAGVKTAEIKHLDLDALAAAKPASREMFAKAIANGMFDFRRKMSWFNPERSPSDYKNGGTRAFSGPRIPGRGIYFERRIGFPKWTRGRDQIHAGQFTSPHWGDETWASWRGSIREVPDWGSMVVGEEGQSDFMQGALSGRRPRKSTDELKNIHQTYENYNEVISEARSLLRRALGPISVSLLELDALRRAFLVATDGNIAANTLEKLRALQTNKDNASESEILDAISALSQFEDLKVKHPDYFTPEASNKYLDPSSLPITPETPIDDTYVRTMVRDLLLLVAEKRADSIAIATTETTARIQNNDTAAHFYDAQLMPSLQKELRRLTGNGSLVLEKISLPAPMGVKRQRPYTVWAARVPSQVIDELRDRKVGGLSLFALAGRELPQEHLAVPGSKPSSRVLDTSSPIALLPEYNARRAEIMHEIDRTIRMLPPDVGIRVQDRVVWNDNELDAMWNGYDRLVYVAMAGTDPVRAVRHEVIHALRQSGLMTDDEFATLYRFAERLNVRQVYQIDASYRDLYTTAYSHRGADFVENLLREETIANMFSDYSLNGRRYSDVPGGTFVDDVIGMIVSFMKRMRDIMFGHGFRDVFDVFESIETGAMAKRGGDGDAVATTPKVNSESSDVRTALARSASADDTGFYIAGNGRESDAAVRDPELASLAARLEGTFKAAQEQGDAILSALPDGQAQRLREVIDDVESTVQAATGGARDDSSRQSPSEIGDDLRAPPASDDPTMIDRRRDAPEDEQSLTPLQRDLNDAARERHIADVVEACRP